MDSLKSKLLPHGISFLIFIALACGFAYPALKGKSIFSHDITQHRGMSKEIQDFREEEGSEPLWTNSMFGGMPSYQISLAYPKNLVLKLDKILGLGLPKPIDIIFKSMLGFYILLIALRVPWKYAIAGAVAFALSSYFLIILEAGHNTKARAMTYVAPAIAGVILAYRKKFILGGAIAALFFALNLACNHVQVTYYMGLSLLIFGLVELIRSFKHKTTIDVLKSTGIAVAAMGLAIGVNNTNLRLTQDYVKDTQRGESRLEIKKRQAEEKKIQAEKARLKAIEEAKKKAKEDDSYEFNEADFLPPKKAYATNWSYGIGESFTLLVPNFSGGGSSDAHKDTKTFNEYNKQFKRYQLSKKDRIKYAGQSAGRDLYWGKQPGVNGPVYLGAGVIFLFLMGLIIGKSHFKWWLLGTAILGLFISWGKNFLPFFHPMFDYFPFYNKFRAITIGMMITEFAVPLLGFIFIKEVIKKELEEEKIINGIKYVGGGLVALLLAMYLVGPSFLDFTGLRDAGMDPKMLKIVRADRIDIFKSDVLRSLYFVVITAGILWMIVKETVKTHFLAAGLALTMIVDLLPVDNRYLNESKYVKSSKAEKPFPASPANKDILGKEGEFRVYNCSNGYGGSINDASTAYYHKDIGGYSSVKLMKYQDMIDFVLGREMQTVESITKQMKQRMGTVNPALLGQYLNGMNVMNMLNTKYIIVDPNQPGVENPHAFGNAWLVQNTKHLQEVDSVMFSLQSTDLRSTAILEGDDSSNQSYSGDGKIELTDYKTNHLIYDYKALTNQFAVFSEINYKGWNAYIDGEPAEIKNVNYVLRGLEVPKGNHQIEFKFEPEIYHQGENISLIASILLLAFVGFAIFREYKAVAA